jgi:N-acetylglucosamine-6-phosphate deacetylase
MTEIRGQLLVGGALAPGRLTLEGGRIRAVALDVGPAREPELPIVAPGLVDLHVHGFGGHDVLGGLADMARALARAGTTAFQPTLYPAAPAELGRHCQAAERASAALPRDAARSLGLHLEGPFVNRGAIGALPPDGLAEPSPAALAAILGPASGGGRGVRTMTVAPELAGAAELVGELARAGIRASLGHSLATAADARAAARAGARGVTHLFNAMRPFHHREAGLVGFALVGEAVTAELIGDLAHVAPDALALALRARGTRGLALVSDALAPAATGESRWCCFGREHAVHSGAIWFRPRPDGPEQLAGSASSLLDGVRNLARAGVCSLAEALAMAGETPARELGVEAEHGRLVAGARADLIVLEPRSLALRQVWVGGEALAPADAAGRR